MQKKEPQIFYPKNKNDWRDWLTKNHESEESVWIVFYKKSSGIESLTWSESVDIALCFGWIDSKKISIDDEKSHQFFSKRKAKSTWSKINKLKIEQLIAQGEMREAGLKTIEVAKENGSWTILDAVEELIIPEDLRIALDENPNAAENFEKFSKSVKKMILYWIISAKRPETRQNRILEIAELAAENLKPKHM